MHLRYSGVGVVQKTVKSVVKNVTTGGTVALLQKTVKTVELGDGESYVIG